MKRRLFLSSTVLAAVTIKAQSVYSSDLVVPPVNPCIPDLDYICAEATGFVSYEHFHRLAIPVSVLIAPPVEGFATRTTTLDQRSLNEEALQKFLKKTGLKEDDIRYHSHAVTITQEELERIASGEERVKIFVKTPKGNFGHEFFFTATKSALIKIQRARAGGK